MRKHRRFRGGCVSRSVRTGVAVSDPLTHPFASRFGSSFLINHLRRPIAYRFWCEACLYSLCEEEVPDSEDHGPQHSNVRSDWIVPGELRGGNGNAK